MHEFALADAVVAAALDVADREQLDAIVALRVDIGELQRIDTEVFRFALGEVMPASEPRLGGTRVDLRTVPARLRCRVCERVFTLADAAPVEGADALGADQAEAIHFVPELAHAFLRCPDCASPDFAVEAGRGVTLGSVEGERAS